MVLYCTLQHCVESFDRMYLKTSAVTTLLCITVVSSESVRLLSSGYGSAFGMYDLDTETGQGKISVQYEVHNNRSSIFQTQVPWRQYQVISLNR